MKREIQAIEGSDVLRDLRCVVANPTTSNCFIESVGLNFVPEDLKRDEALNQVMDEDRSPGGQRGLFTQIMASADTDR